MCSLIKCAIGVRTVIRLATRAASHKLSCSELSLWPCTHSLPSRHAAALTNQVEKFPILTARRRSFVSVSLFLDVVVVVVLVVCGIGRSHEKLAEEREFLTPTQLSPTRRILNTVVARWW